MFKQNQYQRTHIHHFVYNKLTSYNQLCEIANQNLRNYTSSYIIYHISHILHSNIIDNTYKNIRSEMISRVNETCMMYMHHLK